jgi:adenylyl-sulfate kinase
MKHPGFTVWFTGMSGAGKSTLAEELLKRLWSGGFRVELLDGDIVRTHLSKGLGFSREDRDTNIRRIGFVCELLSRNSVAVIVAAISPYRDTRDEVKKKIQNFVEIFVDCPIDVLTQRDTKGLYKKALAGTMDRFTGISDPYEPPVDPAVVIHSDTESVGESSARIWAVLQERGLVSA